MSPAAGDASEASSEVKHEVKPASSGMRAVGPVGELLLPKAWVLGGQQVRPELQAGETKEAEH